MPVYETRSRIVSIRLSDSEFQQLTALCTSKGARCVSDLARDAIRTMVAEHSGSGQPRPAQLHARVNELGDRINGLQTQISWLVSVINENAS